jgi:ABC-2 type transport system ATP-binding protein
MTVFINSHLLSEVEMVCDRVAIVARGRVVRDGRLADLLDAASLRVMLDRVDDGLLEMLGRIAPVANVEETTVTLDAEAEAAPLIAEAVIGAGYRLFGLVPLHRSLEDVFMQLVEELES